MNTSSTQMNTAHVASLTVATTRFIRVGRGLGWEGLRVLPVAGIAKEMRVGSGPDANFARG